MKLKINKKELTKVFSQLEKVIEPRSVIHSLECAKITVKEDEITIVVSNTNFSIKRTIKKTENNEFKVKEEGTVVLDTKVTAKILRSLEADEIEFNTIKGKETSVRIKGGKSKYDIQGISVEDYPKITFNEPENQFSILGSTLKSIIESTIYACDKNETRPILTGLNMKSNGHEISFIATDGRRLAKRVIVKNAPEFNVVVPKESLSDVLKTVDDKDELTVFVDDRIIVIKSENTIMRCRLIEGTYIDAERIIPTESETQLKISSDLLYNVLNRVSILNDDDHNKVEFEFNDDELKIRSSAQFVGVSEETITEFEKKGKDLFICFDYVFLRDALKTRKGTEVTLYFKDCLKPFIIKNDNDDKDLELICPVRF